MAAAKKPTPGPRKRTGRKVSKTYRLNPEKLAAAQRILGAATATETEECEALSRRIFALMGNGAAQVTIRNDASATTSFARGDAHVASETETVSVTLFAELGGRCSTVSTNRIDDAGLRELVSDAKASAEEHRTPSSIGLLGPQRYPDPPRIYFPAAEAALIDPILRQWDARAADRWRTVFSRDDLPGANKIGLQMLNRRLRELPERELGARFDIREFHDPVLEDGAVTLPMLRAKIEAWAREQSGRKVG